MMFMLMMLMMMKLEQVLTFFGADTAILTSGDAACRRPVPFLRMMLHCIMAPGFRPKVRPANRPQGRRHWDWQRHWFPNYAILAV